MVSDSTTTESEHSPSGYGPYGGQQYIKIWGKFDKKKKKNRVTTSFDIPFFFFFFKMTSFDFVLG